MKHFIIGIPVLLTLSLMGCKFDNPDPERTGPEPPPPILYKLVSIDSITAGDYRGIQIGSQSDEAFAVLENYRKNKLVTYQSAVNNYFSDITELKNKIQFFENLTLDEKMDTPTGVQVILEGGQVKSLTLNSSKVLRQWPESASTNEAVQLSDKSDVLYNKLVALSTKTQYANKFQKIVLTTRYTYAIYDPIKAKLPWSFVYWTLPDLGEEIQVYFKDDKVLYIMVRRFEKA